MNIIQRLDKALASLRITFYPGYFQGDGEDYGIYENFVKSPEFAADDEPQVMIDSCDIHVFVKSNQSKVKKSLLKLLKSADFSIGEIFEQYEPETGYTHMIVGIEMIDEEYETEE